LEVMKKVSLIDGRLSWTYGTAMYNIFVPNAATSYS